MSNPGLRHTVYVDSDMTNFGVFFIHRWMISKFPNIQIHLRPLPASAPASAPGITPSVGS